MHEPITIVRKRKKDGTAGDWEILVQPHEPMAKHIDARTALVKGFPVSEDIAEIQIADWSRFRTS